MTIYFKKLFLNPKESPQIIKIHGSVNYKYIFSEDFRPTKRTRREIFEKMMEETTQTSDNFRVADLRAGIPTFPTDKAQRVGSNTIHHTDIYELPQILVPIHDEHPPANPFFIDRLNDSAKTIKEAELVIAIGYNFGDISFGNELKNIETSDKELILVGTSSLYNKPLEHLGFKNVSKVWNEKKISIFKGDGFSDFINAVLGQPTLKVNTIDSVASSDSVF